jgi:hypothetical protein
MDSKTPDEFEADVPARAPWQPPRLTVLGSLASQTLGNTLFLPDMGGSGTLAGDSGTIT